MEIITNTDLEDKKRAESVVTERFRVDQYDAVYDEDGLFYCTWPALTDAEKEVVRQNPFSAR
jgi:hypothetical protein